MTPEERIDEIVMRLRLGHMYEDVAKAALLDIVKEARIDEIAMFFQKFEMHEDIGSTPSDLFQPEPYYEADIEDVAEYFDGRLNTLNAELQNQQEDKPE
jgi:hypothetical protein